MASNIFEDERGCKLEWQPSRDDIDREIAYFGAQNRFLTWENDLQHIDRTKRLYDNLPSNEGLAISRRENWRRTDLLECQSLEFTSAH
jgi:hypothetical protein